MGFTLTRILKNDQGRKFDEDDKDFLQLLLKTITKYVSTPKPESLPVKKY